jgi:hypothetical protein
MSTEQLVEAAEREGRWYRAHPRAKFGLWRDTCAISKEEADETATLLQALADALIERELAAEYGEGK